MITWCPSVLTGFGAALAAISADGKSFYIFDALEGKLETIFESMKQISALTWASANSLLLGTREGELIHFNPETKNTISRRNISENAILFISENSVLDALGRFFYQERLVLDDGTLQPRALIEEGNFIFFVKWKNVYRFEKESGSLTYRTLEEVNSIFVHATLLESLVCITDAKEKLILSTEGLKRVSQVSDGTASPRPAVSDDEDVLDSEANENGADEVAALERDKVFGVCSRRGRIAAIFGTPNSKSAWIEIDQFSVNMQENPLPIFEEIFANVSCPLCPDSGIQKLNATTEICSQGHPISICSESLSRIDSLHFYRCRRCRRSYKTRHDSCKICGFFLTRNK
jgi:hypothetical protein